MNVLWNKISPWGLRNYSFLSFWKDIISLYFFNGNKKNWIIAIFWFTYEILAKHSILLNFFSLFERKKKVIYTLTKSIKRGKEKNILLVKMKNRKKEEKVYYVLNK